MFGKTFRKIRKNKGLLQKEVCSGIVSLSYYSRIERDQYSPTIEIFLQLLVSLNVTFDEFIFIHNGNQKSRQDQLWDEIFHYYYKEDAKQLQVILEEIKSSQEPSSNDHYYIALIEIFLIRIGNEPVNEGSIKQTVGRLLEIEDWTYFEIKLFISIMDFVPLDLNYLLVDQCLKSQPIYQVADGYESQYTRMLVNIICVSLMEGQLHKADHYLTILHKSISIRDMYTKNVSLFFSGVLFLLRGETGIGEQKIKDSFEIFSKLEMVDSERRYQRFLESVLKKQSKKNLWSLF